MMEMEECPAWLRHIWAKSSSEEDGESLFEHTQHVLINLQALLHLRPLYQVNQTVSMERCLFWAAWLHDFGKVATGFQAALRTKGTVWEYRHEILSLAFLSWLPGISEEEQNLIAAAIVFHHKDRDEIAKRYYVMDGSEEDPLITMIDQIALSDAECLWRWLYEYGPQWSRSILGENIAFDKETLYWKDIRQKAAGNIRKCLGRMLEWLNSTANTQCQAVVQKILLRGSMVVSDHSASAHVLTRTSPVRDAQRLLAAWRRKYDDLYWHQQVCMATSGSIVLNAPTGSGKTEAALLWACAQASGDLAVPRLFYCLPFQASMNAMYDRLRADSFPGAVGLEHSRSTMAQYKRAVDEQLEYGAAAKRARWEKSLARLHYYPVRVLSPYQLLKAPYRLPGYEMLLTDCYGAVFILDEVHAYEPERLAQILAFVKYLREHYQARFLIMSATLPNVVKDKLTQAIGQYTEVAAHPDLYRAFQRHKVELRQGDLLTEAVGEIRQQAAAGKRVLVCCNTIQRAQSLYRQLRKTDDDTEMILLHSQFHAQDRLAKEQRIQTVVGTGSAVKEGLIVVATQIIEVSLDIDMDVLYSDPAPLEALVQRFGRINRRKKNHEWSPVYVFSECEEAMDIIYNRTLVERSLERLSSIDGQLIEENQVNHFLNNIYQGEVVAQWEKKYKDAYRQFTRSCINALQAFMPDEQLEELFYSAFDSVQILPGTLEEEYVRFLDEQKPIEASQLLVAISWSKYRRLQSQRQVRKQKKGMPPVVFAKYTEQEGLEI